LNPTVAFRRSDFNLSQGQLTSRGFMQHVHLGQILSGSYKSFLGQVQSPDEIYVRSTNYVRTLQVQMIDCTCGNNIMDHMLLLHFIVCWRIAHYCFAKVDVEH
jgi:hypothetical protein